MKYILKKYKKMVGIQRLDRVIKTDSFKDYKSGKLNCGFSYVEVLLSVILLALLAAGIATAFYVPSSGMKSIEVKQLAYTYAQREMEFLINRNFDEVSVGTNRTEYMDDNFEYSINTTLVDNQPNLKNVRILFYPNPNKGAGNIGESSDMLSDLVNNIVKIGKIVITEDFNDKIIIDNQPFTWTHTTQWSLNPAEPVYFEYTQPSLVGNATPNWPGMLNYTVKWKTILKRNDNRGDILYSELGGRVFNNQGYYLKVEVNPGTNTTRVIFYRRASSNPDTQIIHSVSGLWLNTWINLEMDFNSSTISIKAHGVTYVYTDNTSPLPAGSITLNALNNRNTREVGFDDIIIEY